MLPLPGTSPSAKDLSKGLIHGNPIITAIRERGGESKVPALEAAVEGEVIARCGDAPVRARLQAIICTAVR